MRIIDIPPYRRAGVNYSPTEGHFMMRELISNLKAHGQLDGVEIDIDEGEPTDHGEETRDEDVVTNIAAGVVKRVKAVCEMGKYDAIITQAGIEPGFLAARTVRDASDGVIFWKGMVYGLDPILERWLLSASMPYYEERDIWRRADISNIVAVLSDSDFGVDNYRFISDVKIFPELDKLCARVKNGEEPFIDILTGENTTGIPQRAPQRTSLKEIVQWAIRSLQGSDPAKI